MPNALLGQESPLPGLISNNPLTPFCWIYFFPPSHYWGERESHFSICDPATVPCWSGQWPARCIWRCLWRKHFGPQSWCWSSAAGRKIMFMKITLITYIHATRDMSKIQYRIIILISFFNVAYLNICICCFFLSKFYIEMMSANQLNS